VEVNENGSAKRAEGNGGKSYSDSLKLRAEQVRHFALFEGIPLEDTSKILATAYQRRYSPGKTLFFEGDPVRQIILLTGGCVKLSQTGPLGQEVILRLAGEGEILCTECFAGCYHCSTAQCMKASTALVWEIGQFQAVVDRFSSLGRNISCVLLKTLNQLEIRFREICTERVATRLSSELVRLAKQVGQRSNGHIEIAISQRDLARMTGTTLFSVSRILGQWEEQGMVKPHRQGVVILDVAALENLSHIDS
jgi:CRP-like cAMP-binding protein